MAYRVTIKITKTDTNQWCFLEPSPAAAQGIADLENAGLVFNDFVLTPTEAVYTKEFEDKLSCNKFLVKLMTLNTPAMSEQVRATHQNWKEEITTKEI